MTDFLLELEGLTKAYPGVVANSEVALNIKSGEVHALLGENGAGKSTLVKMIYGLVKPDQGVMFFDGRVYAPSEPRDARSSGIAMVFQHFSLFEALNVAENIALGMDQPPKMTDLSDRIREISAAYGLPLDPDRIVGDLSAGERQRVEVIRCLLQDPKLLIMDEPTSVLTPQEVTILFETLRRLRDEGTSILYISHKLDEIRRLCESATILRHGKVSGHCDPRETSAREMAELMVGSSVSTPSRAQSKTEGATILELRNLSVIATSRFGTSLRDISLSLRKGEILGIGGVAGNGQDELVAAVSGETPVAPDMIHFNGVPIGSDRPGARRALGLSVAPEERNGHSAASDMSLIENAILTGSTRKNLLRRGMINWARAQEFAESIITAFDVRTPGPKVAARALSGGNLQKYVIGREVLQEPSVFVVNQPTWGVDAAAASSIRQAILDMADRGAAVIVVSQDLDELMEISDSFAALNAGRLSAPRPMADLTIEEIGLLLGGAHDLEDAHDQA